MQVKEPIPFHANKGKLRPCIQDDERLFKYKI